MRFFDVVIKRYRAVEIENVIFEKFKKKSMFIDLREELHKTRILG